VVALDWPDGDPGNQETPPVSPSPGGEGRDEGVVSTHLSLGLDQTGAILLIANIERQATLI
jgi:hypothetical protein